MLAAAAAIGHTASDAAVTPRKSTSSRRAWTEPGLGDAISCGGKVAVLRSADPVLLDTYTTERHRRVPFAALLPLPLRPACG